MTDEPAYRSWLTLHATTDEDAGWPHGPWQPASAVTDATDPELAELRRRIVDPVVASLLSDDELDAVAVFETPEHDIRVTIVARGEESYHYLQNARSLPIVPDEATGMAAQLASELEDFVAESHFGWGTQRVAVYEIPPA